jgi:hypothetical protein
MNVLARQSMTVSGSRFLLSIFCYNIPAPQWTVFASQQVGFLTGEQLFKQGA